MNSLFAEKQSAPSYSPLFLALLSKRGFVDPEVVEQFLAPHLDHLQDPFLMKGMAEAVTRIQHAIQHNEKILVHGDYDVDGITGTSIVAQTLTLLKASVATFLPERMRDGYGISEDAIRSACGKGFTLLITADCGISAHQEIEVARSLGMDSIIIDHHRIPKEGLPPASVILNPQQEDCSYPFKELSAGGLAFKLSQALIGPRAFQFLDLAALSTVGDMAPLFGENRIVVKQGLQVISQRSNPGIRALIEASGIKVRQLDAGHLGFMLAPRINACGRMSTPDIALRLLTTANVKEAESLASVLNEENKARQKEERLVVKEAISEVEKTINFNRDRIIVVGKKGWHAGVIGIVASRLVEKYYRPAVVIALQDGVGKGSGRSIKHFNLFQTLETCKGLFEEFGGHEQAVGLTIREENIPAFRLAVNQFVNENYTPDIFIKKIPVEMELKLENLRPVFVQELKLLEPHGIGNPRPVFQTKNLEIKTKPKSQNTRAIQFWVTDGYLVCEAVWRGKDDYDFSGLDKGSKVDLLYSIKIRVWDGQESLILEVKEIKQL